MFFRVTEQRDVYFFHGMLTCSDFSEEWSGLIFLLLLPHEQFKVQIQTFEAHSQMRPL